MLVRLYDGREVEAKVTRIVDSVAGRKVHIAYGLIALKVDPEQIDLLWFAGFLIAVGLSLVGRQRKRLLSP